MVGDPHPVEARSRDTVTIPFSVSLMALIVLIVVPLCAALLWLGWRAVDTQEQRSTDQRIASLENAVSAFLSDGLRTIISAGQTLGAQPSFARRDGTALDAERSSQLAGLLQRHPAVAATFVGYDDGHFVYAGRVSQFSWSQREEFEAPEDAVTMIRIISGESADRRETLSFVLPDGSITAERSAASDYDPRTRYWYRGAVRARGPFLTNPYHFAASNEPGISAGVPSKNGGVIGFDFTLGTLSRLLAQYKLTPNSIVVLAAGSDVLIESESCKTEGAVCYADDRDVRRLLRTTIAQRGEKSGGADGLVEVAGRTYRLVVRPLPPLLGRSFAVVAAMPMEELSAASRILLERSAGLAAAAIGIAMLAALATAFFLSRAIRRIATKTDRIRRLDFSDSGSVRSRITEVRQLSDAVERLRQGLEIFGRYVSKNLVTQIMRSPESAGIGGVRRDLTVMFTDIQGFSMISEDIEPELLMSRLSRYFEALGNAINANHGTIDKYIGDCIMAFWNAPELDPDHVAHACRAALEATAASQALGSKWRDLGRPAFHTRIGIHTGPAVVGNVGARERINYTLVGAVANQASRLEGLNKAYGTDILASGDVVRATGGQFVWRLVDRAIAAGTTEVMEVFQPLGIAPANGHEPFLARWNMAQAAYSDQRFNEAILHFAAALEFRPGDGPCTVFIERCHTLARNSVPADWDGVWRFDKK